MKCNLITWDNGPFRHWLEVGMAWHGNRKVHHTAKGIKLHHTVAKSVESNWAHLHLAARQVSISGSGANSGVSGFTVAAATVNFTGDRRCNSSSTWSKVKLSCSDIKWLRRFKFHLRTHATCITETSDMIKNCHDIIKVLHNVAQCEKMRSASDGALHFSLLPTREAHQQPVTLADHVIPWAQWRAWRLDRTEGHKIPLYQWVWSLLSCKDFRRYGGSMPVCTFDMFLTH